jgi:membrane protease YdiL (CAAX protease family)
MLSTIEQTSAASGSPVATWWHTVLVILPLAAMSVAGWYQHGLPNAHILGLDPRLSSFVTVVVVEWFLVFLIWLALRRRGLSIGSMVSGRWETSSAFFKDLGLAVGFVVIVVPLVGFLAQLLGARANTNLANITPKTVSQLVVWLGVAATPGFCEEIVFRGYLMRQFSAWTGSPAFAIALQGVLFGLAHGFYKQVMVAIMFQGWLLGLFAYWRRNLRPAMLAHGLQDTIGGLVAFFS